MSGAQLIAAALLVPAAGAAGIALRAGGASLECVRGLGRTMPLT